MGGLGNKVFGEIVAVFWGQSVGLSAIFSVNVSLSTLGPMDGLGSELLGEIIAKYFRASGWPWQRFVR